MTELLNTLYVQTPGTSLHLDGDTVRVCHPDQPGRRLLPLVRLDHLVLFSGVTASDDLLLRCADELHAAHQVSDETWADLRTHLSERDAIEVLMLVGAYEGLAMTLNGLGVQVERVA